jgi:uncharacterized protein
LKEVEVTHPLSLMSTHFRKRRGWREFVAVVLLVSGAACERRDPAEPAELSVTFETGTVLIETSTDTSRLRVEIAESDQQRRVGLMRRDALDPDAGMIFLFEAEQPPDAVFWMYNTLIPLSIAFLGADGRIGNIRDMDPCPSPYPQWCPNYAAEVPFHAALEVNQGYFVDRGIGIGHRVLLRRN